MISWKIEKRTLKSLKEHPRNPRKLSKHDAEQLQESIKRFGIVDKLTITPDGQIIGGHQRKRILHKMGLKEVECNVPDRDLTDAEIDELTIRLNRNVGEWDWEKLANDWDLEDLGEWGFVDSDFQFHADEKVELDEDENVKDDEPFTDDVTIRLSIPNDDAASFENQLDELLKKFPHVKAKKS